LGLGLAIVRHLVELHGGEVHAESEGENKGATFTVILPVANETQISPAKDSDNGFNLNLTTGELRSNTDLTGLRLLLVDDEPDTLEVLRTALTEFGATVRTAVSSADALETFLVWKPNVLVSDLAMPHEDGFSLIRKIRGLQPEQGNDVPAIALTAYAREEDRLRALDAGFQTHIPKPTVPDELAAEVKKLTNQSKKS
jgi:CheY-like chemotaxis protein